jgi:chorismate synthase
MSGLRWLTAGESHGPQLTAILEGCPAGLAITRDEIDRQLARRQRGYGRGPRQQIEQDRARILGGVRHGRTTGAPIALVVANRDHENWADVMRVDPPGEAHSSSASAEPVTIPRPGHADLGGALLHDLDDIRDVIERSSARETAARVACGAVARALLAAAGCTIASHVVAIGGVRTDRYDERGAVLTPERRDEVDDDPVRCLDAAASLRMRAAIDAAAEAGDTLGGVFEVVVFGFPAGVGSYVQGDRRLGSAVAAAVMSINAVKGVEIGLGFGCADLPGSKVHDEIVWDAGDGYRRAANRAGGIEGGMSTGEPIVVRAVMKPIATLRSPLATVRLGSHEPIESRYERSDTCAVPAASLVGEAMVALCLADALLRRFGGATVDDLRRAIEAFRDRTRRR